MAADLPTTSQGDVTMATTVSLDPPIITQAQKDRTEQNRQKALALRKSCLHQKPYSIPSKAAGPSNVAMATDKSLFYEDTHGGFFLEDELDDKPTTKRPTLVEEEAPAVGDELFLCEVCQKRFAESFLMSRYKCSVCNECRDPNGTHALITKTEAKERFLLKDCDFEDRGGPPLPYIVKRNPHSSRGDMKLYLICQVAKRSHDLWGGEEGLDREIKKRDEAREKKKRNQYSKQVKELRKTVYATSVSRSKSHTHSYQLEQYNAETDVWTKSCEECGHSITFEKM